MSAELASRVQLCLRRGSRGTSSINNLLNHLHHCIPDSVLSDKISLHVTLSHSRLYASHGRGVYVFSAYGRSRTKYSSSSSRWWGDSCEV